MQFRLHSAIIVFIYSIVLFLLSNSSQSSATADHAWEPNSMSITGLTVNINKAWFKVGIWNLKYLNMNGFSWGCGIKK